MIILPAIDIKDGRCVRLYQGDYTRVTTYANDPLEVARRFQGAGASWLHIVDLDGAAQGFPVNAEYRSQWGRTPANPRVTVSSYQMFSLVKSELATKTRSHCRPVAISTEIAHRLRIGLPTVIIAGHIQ